MITFITFFKCVTLYMFPPLSCMYNNNNYALRIFSVSLHIFQQPTESTLEPDNNIFFHEQIVVQLHKLNPNTDVNTK